MFMAISTRMDVLQYSFFSRTVIDWNHLDEDIISAPTVPTRTGFEIINTDRSVDLYAFSISARIRLCWSIRVKVEGNQLIVYRKDT